MAGEGPIGIITLRKIGQRLACLLRDANGPMPVSLKSMVFAHHADQTSIEYRHFGSRNSQIRRSVQQAVEVARHHVDFKIGHITPLQLP